MKNAFWPEMEGGRRGVRNLSWISGDRKNIRGGGKVLDGQGRTPAERKFS